MFLRLRPALAFTALVAALTTALLIVVFELWRADFRVPFAYDRDFLLHEVIAKAFAWSGFAGPAGSAALPVAPDLSGVRLEGEPLNLAVLLALGSLLGDPVLAVNLFVVASFPVAAVVAAWACRTQGLGRPAAVAVGILFGFLPLHVGQALEHPMLAALWGVPIAASLALGVANRPTPGGEGAARWRPTLPLAALAIATGLSGWLVAIVAATMLVIAAGIGGIRVGRGSLGRGLALAALVLAVSGTALVPYLVRTLDTGIGANGPQPTEFTSLARADLAELVLPVGDHRVPPLAALRARYAARDPGLDPEGGFALGLLGVAGLAILATSMLGSFASGRRRWALPVAASDGVLVLGLLIALGSGGMLALTGALVPFLDRWTPVAAFVGFVALLAVGRIVDHGLSSVRERPRARMAALGLLAVIVVLGVADQASPSQGPDHGASAAGWVRDETFVRRLEQRLPDAHAVFELDGTADAEPAVAGLLPSDRELRTYMSAQRTRWDGNATRTLASWQQRLATAPVPVLLPTLVSLGFDVVAVRRPDEGNGAGEMGSPLAAFLEAEPIRDLDDRWLVFDLSAYRTRLEASHGATERAALAASALAGGDLAIAPFLPGIELIATGFDEPVAMAVVPGGSGAIMVAERGGLLRLLSPGGGIVSRPVLDLRDLVKADGPEQGLLGVALHPRFAENRRIFVHYTNRDDDVVVAEYRLSESLTDSGDGGREILHVPHSGPHHNGGQLAFGPDGYLYIGIGDGVIDFPADGSPGTGQDRSSLLGSILRIDVDTIDGTPYMIPSDNPFAMGPGRPETWAYGLRNPWRFSFDQATGDLFIADVGRLQREELDVQSRASGGGENYGWRVMEGSLCLDEGCDPRAYDLPVHEYAHGDGRCAIVGGYVYRGTKAPRMDGTYVFGDFCSGQIWSLDSRAPAPVAIELVDTDLAISTFGQTSDGEVLVADLAGGGIYHLRLER